MEIMLTISFERRVDAGLFFTKMRKSPGVEPLPQGHGQATQPIQESEDRGDC